MTDARSGSVAWINMHEGNKNAWRTLRSIAAGGTRCLTTRTSKLGDQDRGRAGDEEYEVGYFASKFALSTPQVRELTAKPGNDRVTLEREAKAVRGQR